MRNPDANQYIQALYNVGGVVEPYDADRQFPCFGFGGIPCYMGQNSVNHCFALNGNPANPDIAGVQGIVDMYMSTLPNISLSGPTLFAPLLEQFLAYVKALNGQPTYQIMILLTDGVIHDMPRTKSLLVDLSALPCSVIIIGVGTADFGMMEELDGDDGLLRDGQGRAVKRDIVQFVEYRSAMRQGNLGEQVLKEVPA